MNGMAELAGGQPHQTTGLVETAGLQGARTAITVDAPTIYNGAGILSADGKGCCAFAA